MARPSAGAGRLVPVAANQKGLAARIWIAFPPDRVEGGAFTQVGPAAERGFVAGAVVLGGLADGGTAGTARPARTGIWPAAIRPRQQW